MSTRLHRIARAVDGPPLAAALALGLLFVVLTIVVANHPQPWAWERSVELGVQSCSCGVFDPFTETVATLAGVWEVVAGAAVIAIVFAFRRRAAVFAAVSVAYSLIYNLIVFSVRRQRPTGVPHTTPHLGAYSYPSGHVGFVMWLCVIAVCVFWRPGTTALRIVAGLASNAVVVAAGLSRLYVGAHWATDVLGGVLLAASWLLAVFSVRPLRGLLEPR